MIFRIADREDPDQTASSVLFVSAFLAGITDGKFGMGELPLSGNHTVTEYEMSGKPYSQKSGLKSHTNERMFQVMTRL